MFVGALIVGTLKGGFLSGGLEGSHLSASIYIKIPLKWTTGSIVRNEKQTGKKWREKKTFFGVNKGFIWNSILIEGNDGLCGGKRTVDGGFRGEFLDFLSQKKMGRRKVGWKSFYKFFAIMNQVMRLISKSSSDFVSNPNSRISNYQEHNSVVKGCEMS